MKYVIYADGACSGNGKLEACAEGSFAVYELDGELNHEKLRTQKPLHHESRFAIVCDVKPTNNFAEATALKTALLWANRNGIFADGNEIHICMDSQLILNQFMGFYATKNVRLRKVYQEIYSMLTSEMERQIHLHWIRGEIMKTSIIGH